MPMCGVPHHAARGYIAKLTELGHRVVMVEQVEDPRLAKGLVKREVARIITPGVVLDDEVLEPKLPRYLAAMVRRAVRMRSTRSAWRISMRRPASCARPSSRSESCSTSSVGSRRARSSIEAKQFAERCGARADPRALSRPRGMSWRRRGGARDVAGIPLVAAETSSRRPVVADPPARPCRLRSRVGTPRTLRIAASFDCRCARRQRCLPTRARRSRRGTIPVTRIISYEPVTPSSSTKPRSRTSSSSRP